MQEKHKAGIGWRLLGALAVFTLLPVYSAAQAATPRIPVPVSKPLIAGVSSSSIEAEKGAAYEQSTQVPLPRKRPVVRTDLALSPDNALLYKQIFALQENGDWQQADRLLALLDDFRLRGHVLYQRYMHPTAYRASFDELVSWMALYADHPGADKIYNLAVARAPSDFRGTITKPRQAGSGVSGYVGLVHDRAKSYKSAKRRSAAQRDQVVALSRTIRSDLSNGAPTRAFSRLNEDSRAQYLDSVEYDSLRARIANSYMLEGKPGKAWELASASAQRSGSKVPQAGWVAGLIAWRNGDYKAAENFFAQTAQSDYAGSWMKAGGAYWASRAAVRARDMKNVTPWLEQAAQHPRTFYGLLATRALGWDFDFNWDVPSLQVQDNKGVLSQPGAQRAVALVAAGQYQRAEDELRHLHIKDMSRQGPLLLAYAERAGMPAFSMRLAEAIPHPGGGLYDAALYPLVPWTPAGGYTVDKALIHAFIRQESRFDPTAQNRHSGATGLMQLMPQTASHVSRTYDFRSAADRHVLKNPQVNLEIGQRYIQELLSQGAVDDELFSLLIAYNAGPGNLRKWKRNLAPLERDPLLFIESIPVAETREFVERVMANYWIYRLRLDQPTPSLDQVASGDWARYVSLDERRYAGR